MTKESLKTNEEALGIFQKIIQIRFQNNKPNNLPGEKKMKKSKTLLLIIGTLVLSHIFFSCKAEPEIQNVLVQEKDTTAPSPVTNLKVYLTQEEAILEWNDPTDSDLLAIKIYNPEKNYIKTASQKISKGIVSFESEDASILINKGTQSFKFNGLDSDTEYLFRISAIDKNLNESPKTSIIGATKHKPTPEELNPAPENVSLLFAECKDGIITISWKNPENEDLWGVELSAVPSDGIFATPVYIKSEQNTTSEFKTSNLTNNTKYIFTAKTLDTSLQESKSISSDEVLFIEKIMVPLDENAPNPIEMDKTTPTATDNGLVLLNWLNSADSDFYGTKITFEPKKDGITNPIIIEGKASEKSSTAIRGLDNGTEYTFTLVALDKSLNESRSVSTTATPKDTSDSFPKVSKIELDKNRIWSAINKTDDHWTECPNITITGSNFSSIKNEDIKILLVEHDLFNKNANIKSTTTYAEIISDNMITATLSKLYIDFSSYLNDSRTYTLYVVFNENKIDTEHTASFTAVRPINIQEMNLSTSKFSIADVINGNIKNVSVTVEGYHLDCADIISLQFYDSTDKAYGEAVTVNPRELPLNATTFTTDIKIPESDDFYTLKIKVDNKIMTNTANLQIYGEPQFSSITIPPAGTEMTASTITATVKGKNFTAPEITKDSFNIKLGENSVITTSDIKIRNDSMISVVLAVSEAKKGDYPLTIESKNESISGTLKINDYSSFKDKIGHIILSDGKTVSPDDYKTLDENNRPVAIIAGLNGNGALIGMAYKYRYISYTFPDKQYLTDIICTPSKYGNESINNEDALTATFQGDTDGYDNYDITYALCPTFYTSITYKSQTLLSWGNYFDEMETFSDNSPIKKGWYIPSIQECCLFYRNKDSINKARTKIKKLERPDLSPDLIGTSTCKYILSSNAKESTKVPWAIDLENGRITTEFGSYYSYKFAVRAFFIDKNGSLN